MDNENISSNYPNDIEGVIDNKKEKQEMLSSHSEIRPRGRPRIKEIVTIQQSRDRPPLRTVQPPLQHVSISTVTQYSEYNRNNKYDLNYDEANIVSICTHTHDHTYTELLNTDKENSNKGTEHSLDSISVSAMAFTFDDKDYEIQNPASITSLDQYDCKSSIHLHNVQKEEVVNSNESLFHDDYQLSSTENMLSETAVDSQKAVCFDETDFNTYYYENNSNQLEDHYEATNNVHNTHTKISEKQCEIVSEQQCQLLVNISDFIKEHGRTYMDNCNIALTSPEGKIITYVFPKGCHHNGYNYNIKSSDRKRYGCIKRCPGKLQQSSDDVNTYTVTRAHECVKSQHKTLKERILDEILKCEGKHAPPGTGSSNIFKMVERTHKNLTEDVSYNSKPNIILRAKKQVNPGARSKYNSITEFYEHVKSSDNKQILSQIVNKELINIEIELIISSSKQNHLILYNKNLMEVVEGETDIFVDATFSVCPKVKGVLQMLTIMATKFNTVVPIMWVLMSKKSKRAYIAVFSKIKELFPSFKPYTAMSDFECALMKSIEEVFACEVHGCYFHWCQAVMRMARNERYKLFVIKNNKQLDPHGHEVLKKLLVLPLLPADKILEEVDLLKELINNKFGNDPKQNKKYLRWISFIDNYITKYWIEKRGIKYWCTFKIPDRTNNYRESYHSRINDEIGTFPDPFKFIRSLINIIDQTMCDLKKARNKTLKKQNQKIEQRIKDATIKDAWDRITAATPWTVTRFLNELSGYEDETTINVTCEDFEREEIMNNEIKELQKHEEAKAESSDSDIKQDYEEEYLTYQSQSDIITYEESVQEEILQMDVNDDPKPKEKKDKVKKVEKIKKAVKKEKCKPKKVKAIKKNN